MNYYATLLLLFGSLGLTVLALYIFMQAAQNKMQKKLLEMPFKEEHRSFLRAIPHYKNLSKEDKEKVEHSIILFVYTKEFIGVGIEVSDEMKVVTAFYACLLLLHKTNSNCYENLKTIIFYPNAVAFENLQSTGGIYTKEKFLIDGQSANDTVVLVWHDAKREAYHLRHDNVIIHEFAHEIDFMDGEIDGVPPLERSKYDEWTRVLFNDYKRLSDAVLKNRDWGKYKLLGSYAATNEAEFFAVVTERFFESPKSLKKHFPELYKELAEFYKLDTLTLVEN